MLNLLIFLLLAIACKANTNDSCTFCFAEGTYTCGPESGGHCICHLGFSGPRCDERRVCSDEDCENGGTCAFHYLDFICKCAEGFWGQRCEHSSSQVQEYIDNEAALRRKYCKEDDGLCSPPHLKVKCSVKDLDKCDEIFELRPFKSCPYAWHCYEKYLNGECDMECNRPECLHDGYECSASDACAEGCSSEKGVCDRVCSLNSDGNPNFVANTIAKGGYVPIELLLKVSERFFFENRDEILATISHPIRSPLVYLPSLNADLEYKQSLHAAVSRRRRSVGGTTKVTVAFSPRFCKYSTKCATDIDQAIEIIAVQKDALVLGAEVLDVKPSPSALPTTGNTILAVCLVVIALPILLVGYRIISAPIWQPPKSEDEVPIPALSIKVPLPILPNGGPTPLHEEAYSQMRISLPIRREWANAMDEQGRTPLFWLIASDKSSQLMLEDLDELAKCGVNVNHSDYKGNTPLSIAITALRPSVCNRLVQWGANPAASTESGASCLHLAVAQDDVVCVQWLLSFPAVRNNINEVDDSDRTALAMAAQGGIASAQIAQMLIQAGADVLCQGNHCTMWRYRGRTALHWAAQFNNLEVMKVLLDNRSDVNCVDADGCTALHFAVQRGSEAATRMLLEAHASTEIANGLGTLPLTMAQKNGIKPLIDVISWYADVRKEGLAMKKRAKKREKRPADSGSSSDISKRSCSVYSPDALSNHSASSGYFPYYSDSTSVGSESSTTSCSSSSSFGMSSLWSPSYMASQPPVSPWMQPQLTPAAARAARPPALPPINEKHEMYTMDHVRSEDYVPRGVIPQHEIKKEHQMKTELHSPSTDSFPLSPYSERSNGAGELLSPLENLGASNWIENEKSMDNCEVADLQEFFVNWQY